MSDFKVFIETDHSHYFKIKCENPEIASMLALREFLVSGSINDVVEILVLDPEDELGFGMPILQLRDHDLHKAMVTI